MAQQQSQTAEQLEEEIAFWRDYIRWWERKHRRGAGERAQAALAGAEARLRRLRAGQGD